MNIFFHVTGVIFNTYSYYQANKKNKNNLDCQNHNVFLTFSCMSCSQLTFIPIVLKKILTNIEPA